MTNRFCPGQRWISVSEPELGLGEVRSVGPRTVTMAFSASQESRQYALANAPLRRAAFRVGDTIGFVAPSGPTTKAVVDTVVEAVVEAVVERDGLLYYTCAGRTVCETALSDTLSFSSPPTRLFAGQFDPPGLFDLRVSALHHRHHHRKSDAHGFLGGRINLLPHQISIASEVTRRITPRVLLADEVGLGKTIEACLILHRLILTGRATRVLIVVPEPLVHQWFLELLRRFSLWFHIYDEDRCIAIEEAEPSTNPFLEHQLLLCHLGLFAQNARRLQQALDAEWDVLVVDEAHHLRWTPTAVSPSYTVVETLGRRIPGLLLLTATPEQLGMASHFARLRLLDPDRFSDLAIFIREAEGYRTVARLAQKLADAHPLSATEVTTLAHLLGESESLVRATVVDDAARRAWIDALLDRHGTGRVMFRNTRATVAGFPVRVPQLHALDVPATDASRFKALGQEWMADTDAEAEATFRPNYTRDPRIEWLAGFLRAAPPQTGGQTLGQQKVLLICGSQRKAVAIEAALKEHLTMKIGAFHEGMALVQRDRCAAWFAEPDGARLLICSEIGSEGRNFQFAHHLVLFDLPLDPALLEQRIGRLDRIGQTKAVQVHVPFVPGSHQEVLVRWHHDGLNAFAENLQGGRELLERFAPRLRDLGGRFHQRRRTAEAEPPVGRELAQLVAAVGDARTDVAARLEQGRDRLLEWNSFRPETAARLIDEIHREDEDRTLETFMLAVFDLYFIEVEDVAPRTYRLGSAGVLRDTFPGLTSDGLTITSDRQRALAREDLQFLTWDHPLVTGALDRLLGSEHGNCSFARWVDATTSGLYVEAVYMLECIAPPHVHVDRFLPPTPVRVMVDHRGHEAGHALPPQSVTSRATGGEGRAVLARPDVRDTLLPRLIERTRRLADLEVGAIVARAREDMHARLEQETSRLRDLQKVNRSVRDEEIDTLVEQQTALDDYIGTARLRLDALRLVHRGPLY